MPKKSTQLQKVEAPKKKGRPTTYTQEIGDALYQEIATTTEGMKAICQKVGVAYSTVIDWIGEKEHPFSLIYTRAKAMQALTFGDKMLEIANDASKDLIDGEFGPVPNNAAVQRAKLQIETLKWQMAKANPKKFGERVEIAGDAENPLTVNVTGMKIV